MLSRRIYIVITAIFLLGVIAWIYARASTFDTFRSRYVIEFVFAVALAVAGVRGVVFYRWFTVAVSAALAYSSFRQVYYLSSKGIEGGAFILPGTILSLCGAVLLIILLVSKLGDQEATE